MSKPKDDTSGQTSLASVGGLLVGAGVTELQANVIAGLIVIGVGVFVLLFRAYILAKWFNTPPAIA
jgi:hypothetical protein